DLSRYRNAAADVLGAGQSPPVGTQRFHGLPFEIGPAERAFVAPEVEAVCVAGERAAHTVVIAHRLLGTRIDEGGPIGDVVAEYVFRMADGSPHTVPIRERFEIADLVEFGRLPFLALPDQKNGVRARWSGN